MGINDFTEFAPASVSSSTSNDAVSGNNQRLENKQQSTMPPKELDFTTYSSEDKLQSSKTLNYFVEFCAGSAALSAEMKKAGFSILPIDMHIIATELLRNQCHLIWPLILQKIWCPICCNSYGLLPCTWACRAVPAAEQGKSSFPKSSKAPSVILLLFAVQNT